MTIDSTDASGAPEPVTTAWTASRNKVRCRRCLYDEDTPGINFDSAGICSYCALHDQNDREYPTGAEGDARLRAIADEIRSSSKRRKFDVVVGVSGGCDSSYLLWKAKELGLRPLAVHYDNTWNSAIATDNIRRLLEKLDVELYTHVVDNEIYNDMLRSFLVAGVPELDAPTDIGLSTTLYQAAAKYNIKYIFEGHSFRTEGMSPLGWCYLDGKYIQSVVKEHGHYSDHKMRTFPNLWFSSFMKYILLDRTKKIRPLYYMDYRKEEVKQMLADEFGWQWYGGHHLENRFAYFTLNYWQPRRFGMDQRLNGYSALIRSGQMTREEGLELIAEPPECDPEIVAMVKRRLDLTEEQFDAAVHAPLKTFRDYKTYKPLFERLRPFFYSMYKLDLVPKSFYVKYTSKTEL